MATARLVGLGWIVILVVGAWGQIAEGKPPKKPPRNAVILFDGKSTANWIHGENQPCRWILQDGALQVNQGNIYSKQTFDGDFYLHLEFWLPRYPDDVRGQARANSGVYLQGRYEIQVLDSYGLTELGTGDCAAIYGQKPPDVNAARPPEEWQSYDIYFRAARFDGEGRLVARPRVTVFWNDVKVHDNVEIKQDHIPHAAGPILLQDHGNPVRYRNIWVLPGRTEPRSRN